MFEILCTAAFVAVAFGGMAVCAWLDTCIEPPKESN